MKTEEQIREMYEAFRLMAHLQVGIKEVDSLNYSGAGILAWVLDYEDTDIDAGFQNTIDNVFMNVRELAQGAKRTWKNSKK